MVDPVALLQRLTKYMRKNPISIRQAAIDAGCSRPAFNRFAYGEEVKALTLLNIQKWLDDKGAEL